MVRCPVRSLTPPYRGCVREAGALAEVPLAVEELNALSSVSPICRVNHSATSPRYQPLQTGVQAV